MVVKWGGEVTIAGIREAMELGVWFRENLYPSDEAEAGLLRLHSTYRHDLQLYSSDEGRVQVRVGWFLACAGACVVWVLACIKGCLGACLHHALSGCLLASCVIWVLACIMRCLGA